MQEGLISQSFLGFARLRFAPNSLITPFTTDPLLYKAFIGLGVLAVGLGLAWLWWSGPARSPQESRLRTGFAMLSLLLVLPICHMEYYILALPLLWALLAPAPEQRMHAGTVAAAILIYIAFTRPIPVSGPGLAGYRDGLKSLLVSVPFFTALALWIVSFVEICRLRGKTVPAEEQPLLSQTAAQSSAA